MTDPFSEEQPLTPVLRSSIPDDNTPINHLPIRRKKPILISCLIGSLFIILLIISIKLILSKKSSTLYNTTTTILTQSLPKTTVETLTFSPKSCSIPTGNVTWNTPGSVFINQYHRCLLSEDTLCRPQDLFIDDIHHTLYVADTGNNRIQKYLLTETDHSKVSSTGITVASQNLVLPQSVFVDVHTEDMYILDFDQKENFELGKQASYRVHLWKKNENVGRILFSEAADHSLGMYYHHITLDQHMNIYVTTRFFIGKWLASTNYADKILVVGMNQFSLIQSIHFFDIRAFVVSDDLTVYIADWQNKSIQQWKVNATEGTTLVWNLTDVMGITMDCNGYLYFVDTYKSTISQLNMVTNETRIIVSLENDAKKHVYHSPSMIKIDQFGNLFVLDGDQVYKFSMRQK